MSIIPTKYFRKFNIREHENRPFSYYIFICFPFHVINWKNQYNIQFHVLR